MNKQKNKLSHVELLLSSKQMKKQIFLSPAVVVRLSGLSLCFENGSYLTASILSIKFIKDINKRGHVVFSLVCTIYAVVNGNEANIGIGENHLCIHTDFQIVAPQAAHVFLCQVGTKKF